MAPVRPWVVVLVRAWTDDGGVRGVVAVADEGDDLAVRCSSSEEIADAVTAALARLRAPVLSDDVPPFVH